MKRDFTVVFDLDGTLAHTAPDLINALSHCIRNHIDQTFTLDDMGDLVGRGAAPMIEQSFKLANSPLDDRLLKSLQAEFFSHYEDNIAVESRLFAGALPLLNDLQKDGYLLAICTNKPEAMAQSLLSHLNVDHYFQAITGGDTFEFRKPDGRHLTQTIAMSGASKGLLIGDSINDAHAAQNARSPLILVDFGYSDQDVKTMGANKVISSFNEAHQSITKISIDNGA